MSELRSATRTSLSSASEMLLRREQREQEVRVLVLLSSSVELHKLISFSGFFLERTVCGTQSLENGCLNRGFLSSVNGVLHIRWLPEVSMLSGSVVGWSACPRAS